MALKIFCINCGKANEYTFQKPETCHFCKASFQSLPKYSNTKNRTEPVRISEKFLEEDVEIEELEKKFAIEPFIDADVENKQKGVELKIYKNEDKIISTFVEGQSTAKLETINSSVNKAPARKTRKNKEKRKPLKSIYEVDNISPPGSINIGGESDD